MLMAGGYLGRIQDWDYYKHVAQDPEFDKEQGKKSHAVIWPGIH